MSEIGHAQTTLESFPCLRSHAVGASSVNIDRICVPGNTAGDLAGTDMVTSTVMGSSCNAASTADAKRLVDYYELVAERSLTTQFWKPA